MEIDHGAFSSVVEHFSEVLIHHAYALDVERILYIKTLEVVFIAVRFGSSYFIASVD